MIERLTTLSLEDYEDLANDLGLDRMWYIHERIKAGELWRVGAYLIIFQVNRIPFTTNKVLREEYMLRTDSSGTVDMAIRGSAEVARILGCSRMESHGFFGSQTARVLKHKGFTEDYTAFYKEVM